MKLFDYARAPNCRRVRIFAAEKGMHLNLIEVDLAQTAQLNPEYAEMNARVTVPMLELDDGRRLTESVAICRYLEEIQPEPALFGTTPMGKAQVEMWHRRVELEGLMAAADAMRNSVPFYENRALPGPVNYPQIPALAERGMARLDQFFKMLDAELGQHEFIAGDSYSIADILALVTTDFCRVVKLRPAETLPNLGRWYAQMQERPSTKA